ncbi:MAG: hypothetical protein KAT05_15360 [Spirochaetes bacterium]|nr:hypothetical protein [Spirochaetota bacterium]
MPEKALEQENDVSSEIQNFKKNVISHLRNKNAQHPKNAATPLECKQKTNIIGQVTFNWREDGKPVMVVLSTGSVGKGTVKITRYYDEALGEWIYKTERLIRNKIVLQYSRLDKKSGVGYWNFRTFQRNRNKKKVVDQLRAQNPKEKKVFEPLEWIQETNARGIITFSFVKNGKQENIRLYSGHISKGIVKIKRYYDDVLEEWIYETERDINGKKVIRFSRLVKSKKEGFWIFNIFYPYREKIVAQLRSENAQSKDAFEPFEWERETGSSGQITFDWREHEQKVNTSFSTGSSDKGNVKISRYYDQYLKEWIYESEKQVNERIITRQSRLIKAKKNSIVYWQFKTFNIYKEKVVMQLTSEDAQNKDMFEPIEWTQETGNDGFIWFFWDENGYRRRVVICTGLNGKGTVKTKRYYNKNLGEWIYETKITLEKKDFIRQFRLIQVEDRGVKHWKFKLYKKEALVS